MATVAIELVDAGLVPARDGAVAAPSPGVALLDAGGIVVGREAAAQYRLKPVQAFDRFWSDLTSDPLPRPVPAARSRADLAYAHLAALWSELAAEGDEALFVVPGTLRDAQLGLLAGIARAASIPVAGYVDLAVAACAPLEAQASVLHLDLQLHQAVLTELGGGEVLRRLRLEVAPRVGLRALQSAWAGLVSEAMVRRTRFDPLHQAASEQQLYDRLPGWLAAAADAEAVEVEVDASAGTFGVSLRREQFAFAAEAYYTQLVELVQAARRAGEPVTLVLSSRSAALPGLSARCAAMPEVEVVTLDEGAAAVAARKRRDLIGSTGAPALVTALPRAVAPRRPAGTGGRTQGASPTHVVFGGQAYALGREPLHVGRAPAGARTLALVDSPPGVSADHCTLVADGDGVRVRDHSRFGTWLNGARVTGEAALSAGDRLRLGTPGVVLELVAVG
jgi:hypothetical protein